MKLPGGSAAIVLAAALAGGSPAPAAAQSLDLSTLTCKAFFEGSKDRLDFVIAWMLGYYTDEDDPPVLDFDTLKDRAAKLGAYCAANPTHGLITAADKVME